MDSRSILRNYADEVGAFETPTNFYYGDNTSFKLRSTHIQNFWQQYINYISRGDQLAFIGEYQQDFVPICFIGNFNFHYTNEDEGYASLEENEIFIAEIIRLLQQMVYNIFAIADPQSSNLLATIVTETIVIDRENKIRTSILRIQMPNLLCVRGNQDEFVRDGFIRLLREYNIFKHLETTPINDWGNIFMPQHNTHPVPLYRSVTQTNYKLLQPETLVIVSEYIDIEGEASSISLAQSGLHMCHHRHFQHPQLAEYDSIITQSITDDLVFILSTGYLPGNIVQLRQNTDAPTPSVKINLNESGDAFNFNSLGSYNVFGEETKLARIFIGMIHNRRANDASSLQAICEALNSIYEYELESGLAILVEFASRGDIWSEEDCELYYSYVTTTHKDLRTLGWMAMIDNPAMYDSWLTRHCANIHRDMSQCTELKVAKAIYTFYWLQIATGQADKRVARSSETWYFYNHLTHTWIDDHKKIMFITILQTDFRRRIYNLRTLASNKASQITDENERARNEDAIKGYSELIVKLETQRFLGPLVQTCYRFFFHPEFETIKNRSPFIVGCRNGVIETSETDAVFRPGRPDDYITISGIKYLEHVNPNDPINRKMFEWFLQLFGDEENAEAFWDSCARDLRGRNFFKEFRMWIGERGNEGKSSMKRLQEYAFPGRTFTPPTTLFTGDRSQSGNATPELAPAMHCLIIYGQEASRREGKFNDGQIKMYTGDDCIYYRRFLTEGVAELPMFKLIYIGNRQLPLFEADDALKDRVLIFPFDSRWSHSAPKDPQEQRAQRHFLKDPNFDKLIKRMAPYYLHELVRRYPEAMRRGIKLTPRMKECNENYWNKFDIYKQYIKNNIETVHMADGQLDRHVVLTVDALYSSFSQWVQRSYPNALGDMTRGDVQTEFELRGLGKLDVEVGGWYGRKLNRHDSSGPAIINAPGVSEQEYY